MVMRFEFFLSRRARDQGAQRPNLMTFREIILSKRYIKTVNMDVISLGFPEQTIPKWLNGYVYEWVHDGLLRCHMRKAFDEVEFHNWKEVVSVNVGNRFTHHTAVIEKSPITRLPTI